MRTSGAAQMGVGLKFIGVALALCACAATQAPGGEHVPQLVIEYPQSCLETRIGSAAGEYRVESAVRVRVEAPAPGWLLGVMATELAREDSDETIAAEKIRVVTARGETVSLEEPVVLERGDSGGESRHSLRIVLRVGEHSPGLYEGELRVGCEYPNGARAPLQRIPLRVRVGCRLHHSIDGRRLYFHFGRPGEPLTGRLEGRVEADAPVELRLSVREGRVDRMRWRRGFSARSGEEPELLPVIWHLREEGDKPREPDGRRRNGESLIWRLRGTPGKTSYALICRPETSPVQKPGSYAMQLKITLVPVM